MNRLRGLLIALGTVVLSATAITLAIVPAQASGSSSAINIWNSSHCMDNASENNSKVQMWSCTGVIEQKWSVAPSSVGYTFTNQHTGWCLTAPASGLGAATMSPCVSTAPQQWTVFAADNPLGPPSGWYDVWQNVSSGYCLTTSSVGNGTVLQMNDCDPSDQYDRWHEQ